MRCAIQPTAADKHVMCTQCVACVYVCVQWVCMCMSACTAACAGALAAERPPLASRLAQQRASFGQSVNALHKHIIACCMSHVQATWHRHGTLHRCNVMVVTSCQQWNSNTIMAGGVCNMNQSPCASSDRHTLSPCYNMSAPAWQFGNPHQRKPKENVRSKYTCSSGDKSNQLISAL